MCGIFGLFLKNASVPESQVEKTLHSLLLNSRERGRDSAGIFLKNENDSVILKRIGDPKELIRDTEFSSSVRSFIEKNQTFLLMGQSRLVMSGSVISNESNQPILTNNLVGLHNGIFTAVNGEELKILTDFQEESDSCRFYNLMDQASSDSKGEDFFQKFLDTVKGSYSIAFYSHKSGELHLASNTGSLYLAETNNGLLFASEKIFVIEACEKLGFNKTTAISQIKDGKLWSKKIFTTSVSPPRMKKERSLKRCSRCILPHTYPFISFDSSGVCNFCNSYQKQKIHGEETLLKTLDRFRSKDGSPDCLVGLSGGRDSCYGMYVLKEKYGMNPIAYTFDWGLTTDVSRRNQARVCGKLGIEHIIRSPDINERRNHVRLNVEAFMKKPHMGMVPLFMAGDKDFYHYGRILRKNLGLKLTVHCTGHEIERLHFKTGFCGVDDSNQHNVRLYDFSLFNKIKLASFYLSQYAMNPGYLNQSLYYSLRAFIYSFFDKDDFLYLYQYIQWDEQLIEKVIKEKLDWEADETYGKNQWRMGDGQTAFTNYIYHTVAGFSEYDNFRSNQVRAGLISREEALKLAAIDNEPKWESLQYFANVVGVSLETLLKQINRIPQLT